MVLNGDAGKIADLLAQLGETIEECGLAGIRRTNDRYRAHRLGGGLCQVSGAATETLILRSNGFQRLDLDLLRHVTAQRNFGPVHAIYPGIAPRTASRHPHL